MLRARESRQIFELARDETSSLRWLTDSESVGTLRSAGTQDLETVHVRFDFDSEVFTSRAYQLATRANMISALADSRRRGISHSTEITGVPRDHAPDHDGPSHPTPTGITKTTVVDVLNHATAESLSSVSQDTTTELRASTTSLVRATESDSELPDFVIHTPETLGLLAIQLGALSRNGQALPYLTDKALPTIKRQAGGRFFKQSARLPLLLRPRQQAAAAGSIRSIHGHNPVKMIILGISESGKSTLAKTMRAGHGDIGESWLRLYRGTVIGNIIESLKWLLFMAQRKQHQWRWWDAEAFASHAQSISQLESDGFPENSLEKVASAAEYLWNHPYIRDTFEHSGTEQLPSAPGIPWGFPMYLPDCAEQ